VGYLTKSSMVGYFLVGKISQMKLMILLTGEKLPGLE
jgi:hypothetical protein